MTFAPLKSIDDLILLVKSDLQMMTVLNAVQNLHLPDWWIGAGFLRNKVWSRIHGFDHDLTKSDIDVVYFSNDDCDQKSDLSLEERLSLELPSFCWSVKNQARMHTRNGDPPYRSTLDAISKWTETATAVAVRVDSDSDLEISIQYELRDLLEIVIRPTPHILQHNVQVYRDRLIEKKWVEKWPLAKVIEV